MRAGVYLLFILILVAGCKKKNSNTPPHTQTCYVGKETIWSGNSRRSIYTFQTDPDGSLRYTTYQDTLGHILGKQTFSYGGNEITGSVLNNGTSDVVRNTISFDNGKLMEVDFTEPDTSGIFRPVYSDVFEYNSNSKVSKFTTIYYSRKGADSGRLINNYQYDTKGNVISYTISDAAGTELANVQYTYDDKKNYLKNYLVVNDVAVANSENNIISFLFTDERTGLETNRTYEYKFNDQGFIVRSIMKQDGQQDVTTWYDYICY